MPSDRQLQWIAENRQRRGRYLALADLIDAVSKRLGKAEDSRLAAAQTVWDDVVGAEMEGHAFPSGLRNGILYVSAVTPAAVFAIQQIYRTALLEQLRSELGRGLRDIKCVLQPLPPD